MSTEKPRSLLRLEYANAAEAYLRSLPREHFMEATPQATQREITVESLALVRPQRPDVQYFNELLVQYPHGRPRKIRQVVPDNMVVIHPELIEAEGSYDLPLQPVGPFWVLEYVSKRSQRKDYDDSFRKYERELKVPYYLLFYPDAQELTLFRYTNRRYAAVRANARERLAIEALDLEMALLEGWVRFWFQGELLPLPAELLRQREQAREEAAEERRQKELLLRQGQQAREEAAEERRQKELLQREGQQAREEAAEERRQKEKLLAQLRELGIEPRG
jgi:Uma2 family endonuclease